MAAVETDHRQPTRVVLPAGDRVFERYEVLWREIIGRSGQVFCGYGLEVLDRNLLGDTGLGPAEQQSADFGAAPLEGAETAHELRAHPVDHVEVKMDRDRLLGNLPHIEGQARYRRAPG